MAQSTLGLDQHQSGGKKQHDHFQAGGPAVKNRLIGGCERQHQICSTCAIAFSKVGIIFLGNPSPATRLFQAKSRSYLQGPANHA